MNTSKQVNVMVGLMFVLLVSVLLYFLWDSVRAGEAEDRQLLANAERGGKLFSLNCRACHGITGTGALENANLPGAPLNIDINRPTDPGKLQERQARLGDTIRCGRIGTLMPPWSASQGGPLNDFQIEQLVALITGAMPGLDPPQNPNAISEAGWEAAVEQANHADLLGKQLIKEISADATTLTLTNARGLTISSPSSESLLRIDQEVVKVIDAPAETKLTKGVSADATEIPVDDGSKLRAGDIVLVGKERLRVTAASADLLGVERGVDGSQAKKHSIKADLSEASDEIRVERGTFGTQASEHARGAQVYSGPIIPPTGPLTGEAGVVPCGQLGIAPAASPTPEGTASAVPTPNPGQPERPSTAQPVQSEVTKPSDGVIQTAMKDNSFTLNNFLVGVGETVTIRATNEGQNLHNLRIAGLDGKWSSDDDFVTPAGNVYLKNGEKGELTFKLDQAATLVFRCDVHPTQMWGQITVTQ